MTKGPTATHAVGPFTHVRLRGFLEHRRDGRPRLLGHSVGGPVTMGFRRHEAATKAAIKAATCSSVMASRSAPATSSGRSTDRKNHLLPAGRSGTRCPWPCRRSPSSVSLSHARFTVSTLTPNSAAYAV